MKKVMSKVIILMICILGFICLESNATSVNDGIDWENIKNSINSYSHGTVYTGEIPDVREAFKMRDGMVEGRDYIVTHSVNSSNVGTYGITITGIGEYKGAQSWNYSITPASIKSAEQNKLKDLNYYEGVKKPDDLKLTFNGKVLKENIDYTLSVLEGEILDAGKRAIYVKGIGNFESTKAVYVTILPAEISTTDIFYSPTGYVEYIGKPITKEIMITNKLGTLKEGKDYTVEYKNNVNVGKASIIITGKGNYTGKVTKEFEISAQSLDYCKVSIDTSDKAYTGKAVTTKVTLTNTLGTLEEGKDYTVEYADNTNVGTAYVHIRGKGNYVGYIGKTFNIVKTNNPIIDSAQDALDKFEEDMKDEQNRIDNLPNELDKFVDSTNKNNTTDKKEETSKPTTKPTDKENIKDETVNNEKVDNETVENEIVMPDNNNVIDTNNQTNISNETIGATTTEKNNGNIIKAEYILYVVSGILGLTLAFIVYKVFIYSKDSKEEK